MHKIIIIVNIYIIVSAPATVAAPAPTHRRPNHHPDTKRDSHASGVISRWRVGNWRVGVRRCAVDDDGVIAGDIDDFGFRLLNDNDVLAFDSLCFYLYLLSRLQISLFLGLGSHALHSIHHVRLLGQTGISK